MSEQHVNVYDYDQNCFISGAPRSLYHYGDSQHIQLDVSGVQFKGYDYGSSSHFSGKVNGKNVEFYDYESSTYFNYSI